MPSGMRARRWYHHRGSRGSGGRYVLVPLPPLPLTPPAERREPQVMEANVNHAQISRPLDKYNVLALEMKPALNGNKRDLRVSHSRCLKIKDTKLFRNVGKFHSTWRKDSTVETCCLHLQGNPEDGGRVLLRGIGAHFMLHCVSFVKTIFLSSGIPFTT